MERWSANTLLRSVRAASTRSESTSLSSFPDPRIYSTLHPSRAYREPVLTHVRIARNCGLQVLRSGGVVRGYTNWGTFKLPKPTTKHQARYNDGHHFIMRFDSSGPVQTSIRRTLGLDPRMIRFSVVKLGDKLEEIKDVEGHITWNHARNISDTI